MSMEDLYQDIILDHYRHPRNYVLLDHIPDSQAHENPSCGDSLKLELEISEGRITGVHHQSEGCAISVSSASMMSELMTGHTLAEARQLIRQFLEIFQDRSESLPEEFGELSALEGVKHYPLRVKCATLAWHALENLLSV